MAVTLGKDNGLCLRFRWSEALCAPGGIRTPNLLIRSPGQGAPTVRETVLLRGSLFVRVCVNPQSVEARRLLSALLSQSTASPALASRRPV